MNEDTLYYKVGKYINDNFKEIRELPTKQLVNRINKEFDSNINTATIYTMMIGIRSTRAWILDKLE